MFLWLAACVALPAQEAAQKPADQPVRIALERTVCFGECPDYHPS